MLKYKSEVLYILKTSKSTEAGKKWQFKVFVITGNYNGFLGLGVSKHEKLNIAIDKATKKSYNNIFQIVPLIKIKTFKTISYPFSFNVKKTKLLFFPNYQGTGVRANAIIYSILKLAGINNAKVKKIGSNNKMNTILATIGGLKSMEDINNCKIKKSNFNFLKKDLNV